MENQETTYAAMYEAQKKGTLIKHALLKLDVWGKDTTPVWFFMVTTFEELLTILDRTGYQSAENFVMGQGNYKDMQVNTYAKFQNKKADVWFDLQAKQEPIFVGYGGGWNAFVKPHEILEVVYLPYPKRANEATNADIVVCENSSGPEQWFTEHLGEKYPNKAISVLTDFGYRTKEQLLPVFDKASIITFTTTFTSLDWFEKALDVIIENNLAGKTIYGNHNGENWVEKMPDYILDKIKDVKAAGCKIETANITRKFPINGSKN